MFKKLCLPVLFLVVLFPLSTLADNTDSSSSYCDQHSDVCIADAAAAAVMLGLLGYMIKSNSVAYE